MHTRSAMVVAASCGLLASCSLVTTWDGLTSDDAGAVGGSSGSGGSASDGGHDADAGPDVVQPITCTPKKHYCGGHVVEGSSKTLYVCTADGGATVLEACTYGCLVHPKGEDDTCKCKPGGYYCGGDKLIGDPTTLYTCKADGTGTVFKHCVTSCNVNPGKDDSCS